jgi:phosphate/phosphite/phosphonate ABC transporter binding protein
VTRGSIGFGIVKSIDAMRGRARLAELCELLGADVGTIVVPHHPETYAKLVDAFEPGEISLAWLPPVACSTLDEAGRGSVLALPVRRGSVSYRSAIIARPRGPKTLDELKGRKMAWVDPTSSSGYLVPRLFLQGAGHDVARMFSEERFLMSHSAVVDAVVSGRFDAGATYCGQPAAGNPTGPWGNAPVGLLTMSGPIPNDAIVIGKSVSADLRSRLLRWLLDLRGARAKVLSQELFGADLFRPATPEHFEPLRRILIAARARGTMPPPPPE